MNYELLEEEENENIEEIVVQTGLLKQNVGLINEELVKQNK